MDKAFMIQTYEYNIKCLLHIAKNVWWHEAEGSSQQAHCVYFNECVFIINSADDVTWRHIKVQKGNWGNVLFHTTQQVGAGTWRKIPQHVESWMLRSASRQTLTISDPFLCFKRKALNNTSLCRRRRKEKCTEETKSFSALVPGSTRFNRDAGGAPAFLLEGALRHTNTLIK